MCAGRPPKPKPLPPPRPTAPAPERTTKKVASGARRKRTPTGTNLKGQRTGRSGTASLRLDRLDTGNDPNLNI